MNYELRSLLFVSLGFNIKIKSFDLYITLLNKYKLGLIILYPINSFSVACIYD